MGNCSSSKIREVGKVIYSKNNLQVVQLSADKNKFDIASLVSLNPDGSSAAVNDNSLILVSPSQKKIRNAFILKEGEKQKENFLFNSKQVKNILSSIPTDKQFKGLLEQVLIEKENELTVKASVTDGISTNTIKIKINKRKFIDYKEVLSNIYKSKSKSKICLNRKKLLKILSIMEKTAPDSTGEAPVFLEEKEGGEILLRCYDPKFKQISTAVMNQYTLTDKDWLDYSIYERLTFLR